MSGTAVGRGCRFDGSCRRKCRRGLVERGECRVGGEDGGRARDQRRGWLRASGGPLARRRALRVQESQTSRQLGAATAGAAAGTASAGAGAEAGVGAAAGARGGPAASGGVAGSVGARAGDTPLGGGASTGFANVCVVGGGRPSGAAATIGISAVGVSSDGAASTRSASPAGGAGRAVCSASIRSVTTVSSAGSVAS